MSSLSPGTRLGPYEILAQIGEGGMGEVYRATDSRLKREVAIKVLPAAFTEDKERLARFEREAQLLAQLHHPNIASIFGLEESGGIKALVMELVDGPTLAERLEAGALSIAESLSTALQIAQALEEAHDKGIVHRDLKPQNVKASREGKVKVLDFGLAKAMDSASGGGSAADLARSPTIMNSPTLTAAAIGGGTQLGVILGTAAYMAPEQAAGSAVDRRADIWSFGVVLYEMLAGRRLFDGETVSHVLAGVLKDAPDFSALPAGTPPRIVELVQRCLRKKPRERLQSIGDARLALEEALADPNLGAPTAAIPAAGTLPARPAPLPWILAAAAIALAALFAALWLGGAKAPAPQGIHAALVAPPETGFGDTFALSPDGRRVVFYAVDQKTRSGALWLRELDAGVATRLASTDGGQMAFWSPDGAQIGFFADGKLKRIDLRGGPAQTICDAPTPRGGSWGPNGRIVFAATFRDGLSIVSLAGAAEAPKALTTLDGARNEKSHRFPVFLPGGESILFLAQTAEAGAREDRSRIEALELATGKRHPLIVANSSPLFSRDPEPGTLLFWREGALLAQRFDPSRLAVAGEPVAIASPVAFTQNEQALASVSNEGTLAYREGERGTYSSLVWLDRDGVGKRVLDQGLFSEFKVSHDGKRLAYTNNSPGKGDMDVWIRDVDRGTSSRITFEEGGDSRPVWSPDDRYLYYSSERENDGTIFRRSSDGMGAPEEVGRTAEGFWPLAASHDGRFLVAGAMVAGTGFDLLRLDLDTKKVTPLVATPFQDDNPALSPDDRLLAYASEQSGRWEVYVQALAGGSGRWQISTEGGQWPRWRGDGKELFFLAAPDRLMSVEVAPGDVPRFQPPREVFRQAIESFDASPDGQTFVALRPSDSDLNRPLTLVTHWPQRLAQK